MLDGSDSGVDVDGNTISVAHLVSEISLHIYPSHILYYLAAVRLTPFK